MHIWIPTTVTHRGGLYTFIQFSPIIPVLGIMLFILKFQPGLTADGLTALEVLKGYHLWYCLLAIVLIACPLIVFVINVLVILQLKSTNDLRIGNFTMFFVSILLSVVISMPMLSQENIFSLIENTREDINAIENGDLISIVSYVYGVDDKKSSLPGPYTEDQRQPLWKMSIRSNPQEKEVHALNLFLPESIGPDVIIKDGCPIFRFESEKLDILYYSITYTPNFKIVTDINLLSE